MPSPISIPDRAPVMPLPGAVLLPHGVLPLYIFEERYRRMLAEVLASDRMFCVTQSRPGVEEVVEDGDMHAVGGIGLVRACVAHADGTSHLILQGIARVRLAGFEQRQPFRVARLEPIPPLPVDRATADRLRSRLLAVLEHLPGLETPLSPVVQSALGEDLSLEFLSDMVAGSMVRDSELRQRLIEEVSAAERVRMLLRLLGAAGEE